VSREPSRRALFFTSPQAVEIREEPIPAPGEGEILVRVVASAISAGTELLIYRGLAPADMPADAALSSLPGKLAFPLKYGYAAVGRVAQCGAGVDPRALDSLIFSFQPHQTHFVTPVAEAVVLPPGLSPDVAALLPTAETAVNLVQDARPAVGEKVVVFGQGVVGLMTTALLACFPLEALMTLDRLPARRQASLDLGAHRAFDPEAGGLARLRRELAEGAPPGADLAFELSGDPAALDQAIALVGYDGRIVIGSWYGEKRAPLDLGGAFHRSRIRMVSSQVSTLAPELRGRWTKGRRLSFALSLLQRLPAERLITHRFAFDNAADAYRLLADHPDQALQVLLTYPGAA
jgi:2-desacetyl-2-hydroxyethyl bacteriochlorophyllide A dehydrogenase